MAETDRITVDRSGTAAGLARLLRTFTAEAFGLAEEPGPHFGELGVDSTCVLYDKYDECSTKGMFSERIIKFDVLSKCWGKRGEVPQVIDIKVETRSFSINIMT